MPVCLALAMSAAYSAEAVEFRLVVCSEQVLPYEPVYLVATLEPKADQKLRVFSALLVSVEVMTPRGKRWWYYDRDGTPYAAPPPTSEVVLRKDRPVVRMFGIDYQRGSGHVFARPGTHRLRASVRLCVARPGEALKDAVMDASRFRWLYAQGAVEVEQPGGEEAKALRLVKEGRLGRFFCEFGDRYEYGRREIKRMEGLIREFPRSRYSDLARMGLALMLVQGVGGRRDFVRARQLLETVAGEPRGAFGARATYYLALVAEKRGELQEAVSRLERALQLGPDAYFERLAGRALGRAKSAVGKSTRKKTHRAIDWRYVGCNLVGVAAVAALVLLLIRLRRKTS